MCEALPVPNRDRQAPGRALIVYSSCANPIMWDWHRFLYGVGTLNGTRY